LRNNDHGFITIDILAVFIKYTCGKTNNISGTSENLSGHIEKLITRITSTYIPGTSLPRYGDGDWNDCLQPADAELRQKMISGWTVALILQTYKRYAEVCRRAGNENKYKEISGHYKSIYSDYSEIMIKNGIVSGFVLFNGSPEYILHPEDRRTGISYRLLPMIRGIISEVLNKEQMKKHMAVINKHLLFPDGAHLMDTPPKYRGGLRQYFRRAEEAAAFLREVGLQYVHAHIRYCESLAKTGNAEKLFTALQAVIPINIEKYIPNANLRQGNSYFSSSDADVKDRYESGAGSRYR